MVSESSPSQPAPAQESFLSKSAYRVFAYFGLFSFFGPILYGFQHDPDAPAENFGYNLLLYGIFIVPHLIMTRSWFKQALWGNPAGSPAERRIYITITVVMWLTVFMLHEPVPGAALEVPGWIRFAGT